jgi:hypothetical protein
VFLRSLETAIKTGGFSNSEIGSNVAYMLNKLNDYAREVVIKDDELEKFNKHKRILQKIEGFYGSKFLELYSEALKKGKVSETELKAEKGQKYDRTLSLTAAYADALVDFLGTIGNYDKKNDLLRLMADNATSKLIMFRPNGTEYDNITKTFFEYMWDAIKQNVEHGFYPAILRSYIPVIYLSLHSSSQLIRDERAKLLDYINNVLKPKLKDKEKMNNQRVLMEDAVLPNEVRYDSKNNKFMWLDASKNESEFK